MVLKNTGSQVLSFTGRLQLSDWLGLGQLVRDEALSWLPPLCQALVKVRNILALWGVRAQEQRQTAQSPLRNWSPIQATTCIPPIPSRFFSQPQSHHSNSSFVLSPYPHLQTSPCPIPYSHSAMDLLGDHLDVWIRAWETSCLTLSKPLNFFVSVCKT